MLNQLKVIFTTSETNLIFLDEIHDIVPGAGVNEVMKWLKSLVNETRTSIFLAGTEDSVRIINSNPELKTRFKRHVKLHNMQFKLNIASTEFDLYLQKLFSDILEVLEFESVFKPNQLELTQLYLATDGNLENISTLMIEAARVALLNKDNELGFSHIKEGFHATGLYLHTRFNEPEGPFVLKEKEAIKFARMLGA
jgi:predicted AAA+ superfamily ATPase